jgi:hypothetical protein
MVATVIALAVGLGAYAVGHSRAKHGAAAPRGAVTGTATPASISSPTSTALGPAPSSKPSPTATLPSARMLPTVRASPTPIRPAPVATSPRGVAPTTPAPPAQPAKIPPGGLAVRVSGNKLVNASGATVALHGVNRSGTEYACVQNFGPFDGPSDDASVTAIASWKGVNAVRIPLNEDCWLGINGFPSGGYSAAQYRQALKAYVGLLHAHGLYAILELHWSAPGAFPANWQEGMPDADHSPTFWSQVATAYRDDPATIFDLFNEPVGVDWPCWRDGCAYGGDPTNGRGRWAVAGMQSLVTTVRNAGAPNVVMLGGLSFANDIAQWMSYLPNDPQHQLAASFHVYNFNTCNTQGCWDSQVAPVALQVPVVTGEIGEDDGQAGFINGYMAWADARGLGYLAWTWDTWGCGPAVLISNYDGTPCPGFGAGYRDHLATLP